MFKPFSKQGILLVDKPEQKTSFYLVHLLRKITGIQKIGHTGTLDPLATGVMIMLIGKEYTAKSASLMRCDKTYETTLLLGQGTDSYDITGSIVKTSPLVPTLAEIEQALLFFQGEIEQLPPMFSAKKQGGKRLYELARKGQEVERAPRTVRVETTLLSYNYPHLRLQVRCSSGTYIRTLAEDLGNRLGCFASIAQLVRTECGPYALSECLKVEDLLSPNFQYETSLRSSL